MKKKLLVFLLVAALALGALGLQAIAGTEQTATPVATALWTASNSVTVDGAADEANWMFDSWIKGASGTPAGRFAKLWNGTDLYLAVKTDGATSLKATLNGKPINVTLGDNPTADMTGVTVKQSGNILEMKVPFASIGFAMYAYTQEMDLKLELNNSTGASTFDGKLTFNGEYKSSATGGDPSNGIYSAHYAKFGYTQKVGSDYKNPTSGALLSEAVDLAIATGQIGATSSDGVYHLWNKYQEGKTNYMIQYSRVVAQGLGKLTDLTRGAVLDFDVKIADLAECKDPTKSSVVNNQYQTAGFGVAMCKTKSSSAGVYEQVAVSIANVTNKGLVLYVKTGKTAYDSVVLNRQVSEDTMHMSVRYGADESLSVFIDDVQVYYNPQLPQVSNGFFGTNQVMFNLWNPAYSANNTNAIIGSDYIPISSDYNSDITVSNVKLGTLNEGDLLESLTFDAIKGENSDPSAVSGNLNLPKVLQDSQQKITTNLTWTSTPAGYINTDTGKVTLPKKLTDVVLTATVAGTNPAITKSFNLTLAMPPVDAWKADSVAVDGNLEEYHNFTRGYALTAEAGKPSGAIAARWTEDTLYLGAQFANTNHLLMRFNETVVIGDLVNKTVTLADGTTPMPGASIAVGEGTAELSLPMSSLGLGEITAETAVPLTVSLEKDGQETGKNLLLSFYGISEKANISWVSENGITVDGKLTEKNWQMYHHTTGRAGAPQGVIGQLWNGKTLYLAIDTDGAQAMSLTVAGQKIEISDLTAVPAAAGAATAVAKDGDTVELKIPFESFYTLYNYGQTIPVELELTGANGTSGFAGELAFTSQEIAVNSGAATQSATNTVTTLWNGSVSEAMTTGQIGYTAVADESGNYTYRMWNKYQAGKTNHAIQRIYSTLGMGNDIKALDGTVTMDFDLCVADMAVYSDPTSPHNVWRQYQPVGLGIVLGRYDSYEEGLSLSITNMEDGLVMFVGYGPYYKTTGGNGAGTNTVPYYGPFKLNKQVGDQFHVTLHYTDDGKVAAYVDDVLVMDFQDSGFKHTIRSLGAQFNLWSPYCNGAASARPEGIEDILNTDSSPKNSDFDMDVVISNVKLGTTACDDLFDLLTFDTIKGFNSSESTVVSDLELGSTLSDGKLSAELVWGSSNSQIISSAGKVNTPSRNTPVTVTATLKGSSPVVTKSFDLVVTTPILDAWKGSTYHYDRGYTFADSVGELAARWDDSNLYISGKNMSGDKLSVTVAGQIYSGTNEVTIPLNKLSVGTVENNSSVSITAAIMNGEAKVAEKNLLLCFFGAAEDAIASYGDGVAADGTRENVWEIYHAVSGRSGAPEGKVGFLWNNGKLYLAVNTENADSLALTVNGKTATVDLSALTVSGVTGTVAKNEAFIEVEAALADFGFDLLNYTQTVPVTVELTNAAGTSAFVTELAFSSKAYISVSGNVTPGAANPSKSTYPPVADTLASGQAGYSSEVNAEGGYSYRFWNIYQEGKTNYAIERIYAAMTNAADLKTSGILAVDFDVQIDDMPVYKDPTSGKIVFRKYQPAGLGIVIGRDIDGEELNLSVSNTSDGLVLYVGYSTKGTTYGKESVLYDGPHKLNKQLGDKFHMTVRYTEKGETAIYVDDTLVYALKDVGQDFSLSKGAMLQFNLWSAAYDADLTADILDTNSAPKNADASADVTVSNVKVSSITGDDLLDLLTFDTIKGLNVSTELIMNDLVLDTTMSDGRLTSPLQWSSSKESAISAAGEVNTDHEGPVTLTAKLGGLDTMAKKFNVTVSKNVVDAWKGSSYTEGRGYIFDVAGKPQGEINARWDDTNLYLQLENTDATKFVVTLNGNTYSANVSGGKAEIKVALSKLNLGKITNTTVTAMGATLSNASGSVSKSLALSFFGVPTIATANWEDSVVVDGTTDEGAWQFYRTFWGRPGAPVGKLSALWSEKNLYLAVNAEGVNKLNLTLNGKTANVDLAALTVTGMENVAVQKTDGAIELKVPFDSFGFTLVNYGQSVPMNLELEGNGGIAGFEADLTFTSKEHAANAAVGENTASNPVTSVWGPAENITNAQATGQIGGTSEKDANGNYSYHLWNKYQAGKTNYGVQRVNMSSLELGTVMNSLDGIIAVDMDLCIADMPVYTDPTSGDIIHRTYQPAGLGFGMGRFSDSSEELNLSVTNTKDGLVLYVGYGPFTKTYGSNTVPYYGPFKLGKQLGDQFHLTFHYTEDGMVSAYVDDVLVMEFQDGGYSFSTASLGVGISLWNPGYDEALTADIVDENSAPKNDGANSDVYISNLKVGTVSCYDLRDLLTFEAIKGQNGSPETIIKNMTLPTTVADGNKLSTSVVWSSSNTKVLANDGTVNTQSKNVDVTLTAKLAGLSQFGKDFDLTVALPIVDAWRTTSAKVNGTLSEYHSFERGYTFPAGSVTGAVAARWTKNTLYLAGKTDGDTMTVTLSGKTIVASLSKKTVSGVSGASIAVGNGTVELGIPMSQLGLGTISQGTAKAMTVSFAKGSAKIQKSLLLTFYGVAESSHISWNDGKIAIDGVLDEDWLMYTETSGRAGSPEGVIGKLWNGTDLFLAVDTDGASKMLVTMNGKTSTIDLTAETLTDSTGLINTIAKGGDIVEMKISYKDFFTLVNYGQTIDVKVELTNEVGASGFDGSLEFTSREHLGAVNEATQSAGNPIVNMYGPAENVTNAVESGQVGYTDIADENGRHTYHMWNKYQAGKKNYAVQRVITSAPSSKMPEKFLDGTGTVTLDFDVRIDDMPVYADPTSGDIVFRKYQAAGLGILLGRNIEGEEMNLVISNTKDGLVLYVGHGPFTKDFGSGTIQWDGPHKLNKALGQEFHVMLHYTENGELAVYVDDVIVYQLKEVSEDFSGITNKGLIFSLWSGSNKNGLLEDFLDANSAPKNNKADTDITISDVRYGTSSGTDILDLITYDTIKNLNGAADSVVSNLKLPTTISDGKITARLSWSSSNKAAISASGVVTSQDKRTPVTMTVSLVGAKPAQTKEFPMTVVMPFVDTWQTNFVKIDGDLSEYYSMNRGYSFAKSSGKPSATISAGWNEERSRVYYAIKYTDTTKITITMGSKIMVVDLANQTVTGVKNAQMKVGKGTVEIAVPLDQMRISDVKNNMLYDIGVKLENAKSSVSKNLTLAFYGHPSTALASWDNKTVVLDGQVNETSWLLYTLIQGRPGAPEGSFGRLWNGSDLYLAVDTDGAKTMTLMLGEKTLKVDLTKATPSVSGMSNVKIAKNGDIVELKIPFKSFGFTLHNYTETVNMKLELINTVGTSGFYGVLQFSSREALFNGGAGTQSASNVHVDTFGDEEVIKKALESGQIGYTTESTATGYAYHMWNIYQEGKQNYPVQRVVSGGVIYEQQKELNSIEGIVTVDFNVRIDDMPEYKDVEIPDTFFRRYQPAGLGIFIGRNLPGEEVSFVITNEKKGLAMYMGSGPLDKSYGSGTVQWSGPYYIGKELGEQFHVSVHQTLKGEVQVYIDDEILFEFQDVGEDFSLGTSGVTFSLWNQWYAKDYNSGFLNKDSSPKNSDANTDLTVSDVQIGTATCYDILDYLDFDYIKGNNGDVNNVITDLELPSYLSDGKLKASLTWESSKPDVVSVKGKVNTQDKDTTVILTASLTGTYPVQKKELEINVAPPPVDSWYNASVKLDGNATEYHSFERGYTFAKSSGKPTASVGAAWDDEMMYVGIKYTGADELKIKIEGKTLKADLNKKTVSGIDGAKIAVGSGVVEVAIPKSILKERAQREQRVDMVVTLSKGSAEISKGLRMCFLGKPISGQVGWGGESMTVDGKLTEIAYQLYGQTEGRLGTAQGLVGKVWSGKDLYLAVYTDDAKTLKLTLNGKTATININGNLKDSSGLISKIAKGEYSYLNEEGELETGTLLEMKIPFANFGLNMYAYGVTADMSVELINSTGISAYITNMAFTNKVSKNYINDWVDKLASVTNPQSGSTEAATAGQKAGSIGTLLTMMNEGRFDYHFWNVYNASSSGYAEMMAAYQSKANDYYEPMTVLSGDFYLDFDVCIDDMYMAPKDVKAKISSYGNLGLCFWLSRGIEGQELVCGISGLKNEGLVFTVRVPETTEQIVCPIPRELGEKFHVSILWKENGDITVYIDDEKLYDVPAGALGLRSSAPGALGLFRMNLLSTASYSRLANEDHSTDFTVSNVLVSYAGESDLLQRISFEDIKGDNRRATEVWKDLVLPQTVTDGVITSELVWESSNPAVVSIVNGVAKVIPQDVDTPVTLTVRLKGNKDIYRTFEITVTCPIVDAHLIETAKKSDPSLSTYAKQVSYKLADGSTVAAQWDATNVYLGVAHNGAETINLTFGEKKAVVNLTNKTVTGIEGAKVAVSGNKAEITLPRSALGIRIPEYNHTERFTIELTKGGKAITSKILKLEFVGYKSILEEYVNSKSLADFLETLKKITKDVDLPKTYKSQYLDATANLTWESDTVRVLTNDGKLERPEKVDTTVRLTLFVNGEKAGTYAGFVEAKGDPDLHSTTQLRVAFGQDIKIDGNISEQGWSMNSYLATKEKVIGKMGVQWDTQYLYMAFEYGSAKSLSITLEGKTANISLSGSQPSYTGNLKIAQIKKGSYLELKIAMKDLGIGEIIDYGETLKAKVMLDGATFDGTFTLTSLQWFATDNSAHRYVKSESTMDEEGYEEDPLAAEGTSYVTNTATDTEKDYLYKGWNTTDDGYSFYDVYEYGAELKAGLTTAASFVKKTLAGTEVFAPMERSGEVGLYTEFDIQSLSMPIYEGGVADDNKVGSHTFMATAGFSWQIGGYANKIEKTSEWISMGMYMSENGLVLMVRVGKKDFYSVPLGKYNGDMFRLGMAWTKDDTLHVFLDGEKIFELENAVTYGTTMSNGGIGFRITRNKNVAACDSDSFKIKVSNLAMGYYYGECILDNIGFEEIRGGNINYAAITADMDLMKEFATPQISSDKLTWECSDPAIASDGTVTRPTDKSYALTKLTVTNKLGHSKEILTAVKGFKELDDILYVEKDYDIAHGVGKVYGGAFFTLDGNNSSIVKDLKETQKVNVVKLTDLDHENRLYEDTLSLWVSDDNATYTEIKDFKFYQNGTETYLYGFETEARYIKVHSTNHDTAESMGEGFFPEMIRAYYEEIFGAGGGSFGTKKTVTVKNTDKVDKVDWPWSFNAKDLGIVSLAGDMADVRIFLGDELLYHYVEDGVVTVRIPEVKAGKSVKIKVLSGNKDAMDISNKEFVYEVIYGTRELIPHNNSAEDSYRVRCMCTLPDGTIVTTVRATAKLDDNKVDCRMWQYSKDNGRTWVYMGAAEEFLVGAAPGGFVYDQHANILYSFGYGSVEEGITQMGIVKLDLNNGIENAKWEYAAKLTADYPRGINYNNGTTLSCYDGDGPNTDMIVAWASSREGESMLETYTRVSYTKDAGKTWIVSDTGISVEGVTPGFERGCSEPTTLELDDGTLVVVMRYQDEETYSFGYSYSTDQGVTWTNAVPSEIYSTNTQPMFLETNDEFDIFTWAGNNIQGGDSYQRYPQSVGIPVVKDDLSNIGVTAVQNTFLRLYHNNLKVDNHRNTNLYVTYTADGALLYDSPLGSAGGGSFLTRVEDYKDYITKSKGSYDSFEKGSTKYEGWADVKGTSSISDKVATDGNYSMRLFGQSVRSVPYFRTGSVSFDLNWTANTTFKLELETTYSPEFGKGSPAAFIVDKAGNLLDRDGTDTGIDVAEGWNEISVIVDLPNGNVTVSANGSEAAALKIDEKYNEYVCYVAAHADSYVYLDNFIQLGEPDDLKPEDAKNSGLACFDLKAILFVGVPVLVIAAIAIVLFVRKKKSVVKAEAPQEEVSQEPETPEEQ